MKTGSDTREIQLEIGLYPPLLRFFRHYRLAFAEVPFFGKRVDLVFASPSLRRLYAVETKMRDWKSAFKQAAINQLAAQHSYIALPQRLAARLASTERALFESYDVGLIGIGATATTLIPPKRNGYFNQRHYRTIKDALSRAVATQKPREIGALTDALSKRSRTLVLLQAWADERERTL